MSARRAVIVDVVRTPFGKGRPGGALSDQHPVDLLALTLAALLSRTGLDPGLVDDVIAGLHAAGGRTVRQRGPARPAGRGPARRVPGVSIDRKCGSFQQAMHFGAQGNRRAHPRG